MKTRLFLLSFFIALSPGILFAQNVGVDVATPQQKLDVLGGIRIGNTTTGLAGSIRWTGTQFEGHDGLVWAPFTTGSGTAWSLTGNSGTTPATNFLGTIDNVDFRIRTNNTDRFTITAGGNVGIGTTTVSTIFAGNIGVEIKGDVPQILFNDATGGSQDDFRIANGGAYAAFDNATTNTTIMALGLAANTNNVGIGTTSPAQTLDVNGKIQMRTGATAGYVPVSDANGTMTWTNLATSTTTYLDEIRDADNDTKVQVEESADEDIIRFDAAGTQLFTMKKLAAGSPWLEVNSTNTLIGSSISSAINNAYNTAVGFQSAQSLTSGQKNTYYGDNAGGFNTTGSNNTMVGTVAGQFNNGGAANTMIGGYAGRNNTSGSDNVILGFSSGENNIGSGNVFIGRSAGQNETGSNKLYLDNSNTTSPLIYGDFSSNIINVNGNLGINTATPGQRLDVNGDARIQNGTVNVWAVNATEGGQINLADANNDADGQTNAWSLDVSNNDFRIMDDGAVRAFFQDDGNLGINTTTPAAKLHVQGTLRVADGTQGTGKIMVSDASGTTTWSTLSTLPINQIHDADNDTKVQVEESADEDKIRFDTFGAERMIIDNAGNVGIGVGSPLSYLDITGTNAGTSSLLLRSGNASNTTTSNQITFAHNGTGNIRSAIKTRHHASSDAGNAIDFFVWDFGTDAATDVGTKRVLTIDGGGNGMVGIGTSIPAEELHVVGNIRMVDGTQAAGRVMTSDANGTATWGTVTSLETDPQVSSTTTNYIPKWNGTTLVDGVGYDNGTNIGIGTTNPQDKLHVVGNVRIDNGRLDFRNTGSSVFIGTDAGLNDDHSNNINVFVGNQAGMANTSGADNTAIGTAALRANTTASFNTAIGWEAMVAGTTADNSTAVGHWSLHSNTDGSSNVAIGSHALRDNVNGDNNTAIGLSAGQGNLGSGNIFIGRSAGQSETGDNKLYIDNSSTTTPLIYGDLNTNIININGNLGINTATPGQRLDVNGDARIQNGTVNVWALNATEGGQINLADGNNDADGQTNAWSLDVSINDFRIMDDGAVRAFFQDDGNLGIATTTPAEKLDVNGKIRMRTGATTGYVPVSDANGTMTWTNPTSLTVTETDPQVSSATTNQVPKWNGTTLTDGIVTDNGTNVGIGTTAPVAKLHVAGNIRSVTSSSDIRGVEIMPSSPGAEGSGRIYFREETDDLFGMSMGFNGGNSGNEILNWPANSFNISGHQNNSTGNVWLTILRNDGNVGIATTAPAQKLDVIGKIRMVDGNQAVGYVPVSDANGTMTWTNPTSLTVTETDPQVSSTTTGYIPKWNGTTLVDGVAFDNGTNIGIGTSTPGQRLDVNGDARIQNGTVNVWAQSATEGGQINLADGNNDADGQTNAWSLDVTNNDFRIMDDGAVRAFFQDDGNLGIGPNAPGEILHVRKDGFDNYLRIDAGGPSSNYSGIKLFEPSFDYGWYMRVDANTDDMYFAHSSGGTVSDRVTFLDGGNVGIGTITPAQMLDVNGKIQMRTGAATGYVPVSDANGTMTWTDPATVVGTQAWKLTGNSGTVSGTNFLGTTDNVDFRIRTNNQERFTITSDGNLGVGTTTVSTIFGGNIGVEIKGDVPQILFNDNTGGSTDDFRIYNGGAFAAIQNATAGIDIMSFGLAANTNNVGIGTTAPTQKLDVNGKIQMRTGATAGYVPVSDANGTMTWTDPTSLTITETDPQVSSTTTNYIPKWNGTTLVDGVAYDNGTNIGIGTTAPTQKLDIVDGDMIVRRSGNSTSSVITIAGKRTGGSTPYNTVNTTAPARLDFQNNDFADANTDYTAGRIESVNRPGINDGELRFYTSSNLVLQEAMNISSTGNVGIGTLASDKLHVIGNIRMVDGNQAAGRVMVSDVNGKATWTNSSTLTPNKIVDADNDTKIQVEESADEDIIRFDMAGTEHFTMVNGRINVLNTGNSVYLGSGAGAVDDFTSNNNIGIGTGALNDATSASWNTAVGHGALELLTTGVNNIGIGAFAMGDNTTGSHNTAIGAGAGDNRPSSDNNVFIGRSSGATGSGSGNVLLGANSGEGQTLNNRLFIENSNSASPLIYGEFDNNIININGNLGVGTAAPAEELHVAGNIRMVDGNQGTGKVMVSDANGTATWTDATSLTVTETDPQVSSTTTNYIPKWNGTTLVDGVGYDNGTNIGIGTTSPTSKLHVAATNNVATEIESSSATGTWLRLRNTNSATAWSWIATGNSNGEGPGKLLLRDLAGVGVQMTVQSNGNVGLGTTSPASYLDITGSNSGTSSLLLRSGNQSTTTTSNQITFGYNGAADYRSAIKTRHNSGGDAGNAIDFYIWDQGTDAQGTVGTKRVLTIDGNGTEGSVGIGTSSPGYPLHVVSTLNNVAEMQSSSTSGAWFRIRNTSVGGTGWRLISTGSGNGEGAGKLVISDDTGAPPRLIIGTDGNVGIGTTSPAQALDVNGKIQMRTGATTGYIPVSDASGTMTWTDPSGVITGEAWGLTGNAGTVSGTNFLGTTDGQDLGIRTSNIERLTLMASGTAINTRVGIGTNTVSQIPVGQSGLEIAGNVPNLVLNDLTGGSQDDFRIINGGSFASFDNATTNTTIMAFGLTSNANNVGIGTTTPDAKLHVVGNIRMVDGNQAANKVMVSDANGTATWTNATSLTVTETDPQVSSTTTNYVPKWNGTTLTDGSIFDNGSVGIGTSTFSTGEKLAVSNGTLQLGVYPGYLDNAANNNWATLDMAGTKGLRVWDNFSVSGTVGIGTTAPASDLEVQGVSGATAVITIDQQGTDQYTGTNIQRDAAEKWFTGMNASNNNYIIRGNATTDFVTIDNSTGNVGIGSTTPGFDLDIRKNEAAVNFQLYSDDATNGVSQMLVGANSGGHVNLIANTSTATYLGIPAGYSGITTNFTDMIFASGTGGTAAERMRLTTAGNLGIGTTTPNVMLHVVASGASDQVVARFTQSNTTNGNTTLVGLSTEGSTWSKGAIGFQRTGSYDVGDITFNLNTNSAGGTDVSEADERMRITSDGRVGIGTNNPTQAKLVVNGYATYSNLNARYYNSAGTNASTTANRNLSAYFSDHIACGELQVFSDERIKNIRGISDSKNDLGTLMGIQITDYMLKDTIGKGNNTYKKVIAQQVEKVYPQAVSTVTDVVPDIYKMASISEGKIIVANNLKAGEKVKLIFEDRTELAEVLEADAAGFKVNMPDNGQVFVFGREVSDFHTVDYEALSMLNISATQELVKMMNQLKNENNEMKNKFSSLSSDVEMLKALLNTSTKAEK